MNYHKRAKGGAIAVAVAAEDSRRGGRRRGRKGRGGVKEVDWLAIGEGVRRVEIGKRTSWRKKGMRKQEPEERKELENALGRR
jgi:hypothetical protein